MISTLHITQPDDWHLHVRDGAALETVVPHSARQFSRALIMPNLQPPITTIDQALAYRQRILAAVPEGCNFRPLMTLYLTDHTDPEEIKRASTHSEMIACKLYPAGATTHSEHGVTDIKNIYPVLETMQAHKFVLCIHGEVTVPEIDVFDREAVFLEQALAPLIHDFPELKIVLEHITTKAAVAFVADAPAHIGATITPQHLLYSRNAIFQGGLRPHYYCLPVLKRETHRHALLQAATSGNPKYFLGTDSAPHARSAKETACGCAGCYSAYHALALYAEAFEQVNALDKLEAFASFFGADFYGLPHNNKQITLQRQSHTIPEQFNYGTDILIPLGAGETLHWQLV